MDNSTAKKLILEKIFNVFAPKIIGYVNILHEEKKQTWRPNLFYIDSDLRQHDSDVSIYIDITLFNNNKNNFKINFTKTTHNNNHDRRRITHRMLELAGRPAEPEIAPIVIEFEFNDTKKAIKEICKHVDLSYLIKLGISAKKEIDSYENPNNMAIGSIKEILGINLDVDLFNLETRQVLLEFLKS